MSNPHFDWLTSYHNAGNNLSPTVEATLALAHEQRVANDLKRIELAHTLMRHHTENVDYSEEIDNLAAWGFEALFTNEHRHVYNSAGESIDGTEHTELRDWVTARLGLGDTK